VLAFVRFWQTIRPHFDKDFYLRSYPDVAEIGVSPLRHYMHHGWKEGRDPAPWFSTSTYLALHPDVGESGVNPFFHYIKYGKQEGRALLGKDTPKPHFFPVHKSDTYRMKLMDFLVSLHARVSSEGRQTGAGGDEQLAGIFNSMLESGQPDTSFVGSEAALELHMGTIARDFKSKFYASKNKDIKPVGFDPLKHYCEQGWKELRNPTPDFDLWWYARQYLNLFGSDSPPLAA